MKRRSRELSFLSDYVDAYLGEAAAMSMTQLRARQRPPHACVALGAAGIAYAFLRAHEAGHGAAHLDQARRWIAAARRGGARADAFRGESASGTPLDPPAGSLAYGRAGVAFVDALVAATGARRSAQCARGTAELLALARRRSTSTADFMEGAAGHLAAITALYARDREPALRRAGDRIAGWLIVTPPPSYGPWFAYGEMGPLHAVLRWSLATDFALPGSWLERLDAIASLPMPDGSPLVRSWCNGSAGIAITMVAAHERTGRASYLEAARIAAAHAAADAPGAAGLCCGLAGRAYALLAVDRIAPERHRRARAIDLAVAAISGPPSPSANALLYGHAGLVCLALDLLEPGDARFPLVQ